MLTGTMNGTTGGDAKRVTDCPTCSGKKKKDQVSCLQCWRLVPEDLQIEIYKLFERERGSQNHLDAIDRGVEAIRERQAEN